MFLLLLLIKKSCVFNIYAKLGKLEKGYYILLFKENSLMVSLLDISSSDVNGNKKIFFKHFQKWIRHKYRKITALIWNRFFKNTLLCNIVVVGPNTAICNLPAPDHAAHCGVKAQEEHVPVKLQEPRHSLWTSGLTERVNLSLDVPQFSPFGQTSERKETLGWPSHNIG